MDKSATFSEAFMEADGLFKEGMYRKALSKFETSLMAAQDEDSIIDARFWIITCHARLEQVSIAELSEACRKADYFCSFSIRRYCVAATSWSLW